MYKVSDVMPRTVPSLFPQMKRQLAALGERLHLARLRRRYSSAAVAQRTGITRSTLYRVEKGDPGVSLGIYASVIRVLGLQDDLDGLARDDALGRKLQDLDLLPGKIAPRQQQAPIKRPISREEQK
jgi:transcriptional regulator with XRE-family HTH domain